MVSAEEAEAYRRGYALQQPLRRWKAPVGGVIEIEQQVSAVAGSGVSENGDELWNDEFQLFAAPILEQIKERTPQEEQTFSDSVEPGLVGLSNEAFTDAQQDWTNARGEVDAKRSDVESDLSELRNLYEQIEGNNKEAMVTVILGMLSGISEALSTGSAQTLAETADSAGGFMRKGSELRDALSDTLTSLASNLSEYDALSESADIFGQRFIAEYKRQEQWR